MTLWRRSLYSVWVGYTVLREMIGIPFLPEEIDPVCSHLHLVHKSGGGGEKVSLTLWPDTREKVKATVCLMRQYFRIDLIKGQPTYKKSFKKSFFIFWFVFQKLHSNTSQRVIKTLWVDTGRWWQWERYRPIITYPLVSPTCSQIRVLQTTLE